NEGVDEVLGALAALRVPPAPGRLSLFRRYGRRYKKLLDREDAAFHANKQCSCAQLQIDEGRSVRVKSIDLAIRVIGENLQQRPKSFGIPAPCHKDFAGGQDRIDPNAG